MEEEKSTKKRRSFPSSWILCSMRCFPTSSTKSSASFPPTPTKNQETQEPGDMEAAKSTQQPHTKHGGWKTMPYILGNETFERLASFGLLMNFMVYLIKVFHLDQVSAINIINIWSGTSNLSPLIGAFICDAYLGRFRTLAFASISSFLGLLALTLTAVVPALHPTTCSFAPTNPCMGPTKYQLGFLYLGLAFLTIGTAGIRPAGIPFGVDQFDPTTEKGKKGIGSFFNWSYTSFTVVIMISITLIVYIQTNISWGLGLGIPTACMGFSIILFLLGTRFYVYVPPEGSVFSGIFQVFVAAFHKRHLKPNPKDGLFNGLLHDPPMNGTSAVSKLPLTHDFSWLNKAAIAVDGEIKPNGSPSNPWRLCSIQQIEEVKCLIGIVPIWASNIICFLSISQQGTFTLSQALKMDRHLGPKFQIPAGSMGVISMLTLAAWIPIYDRILVPSLRRITKHEGGITLLQRIGIGMLFSIMSMVVAGIVEEKRRTSAIIHGQQLSVFWLAPQLILMGFCEAFNIIGQIEFYYKQFPEHMKSIANSLLSCTIAGASYLSSLLVVIVHKKSRKYGHDWLDNDINAGRVDYFYYLIAALGVLNFIYFLICAYRYHYKGSTGTSIQVIAGEEEHVDSGLNSTKHLSY